MAPGVFHCDAQNFDAMGGTADIDWPPAPIASEANDPTRKWSVHRSKTKTGFDLCRAWEAYPRPCCDHPTQLLFIQSGALATSGVAVSHTGIDNSPDEA
jgi:hypothetical protein